MEKDEPPPASSGSSPVSHIGEKEIYFLWFTRPHDEQSRYKGKETDVEEWNREGNKTKGEKRKDSIGEKMASFDAYTANRANKWVGGAKRVILVNSQRL